MLSDMTSLCSFSHCTRGSQASNVECRMCCMVVFRHTANSPTDIRAAQAISQTMSAASHSSPKSHEAKLHPAATLPLFISCQRAVQQQDINRSFVFQHITLNQEPDHPPVFDHLLEHVTGPSPTATYRLFLCNRLDLLARTGSMRH